MNRRHFVKNTLSATLAMGFLPNLGRAARQELAIFKDVVLGHGTHQYKVDLNWGALNSNYYPVKDCHEMVQDSKGRIILLTNETKNNVIVYDKSGELLEVWGTEYPGAHGLTLNVENGEDFLYIADNNRHEIIKTTIDGKEVMTIPFPKMAGKYDKAEQYVPTETAIAPNGDIYVSDGYGSQYVIHYNAKGELQNIFGGKGEGGEFFDNAHGICIDQRDSNNPTLLITERERNQLKRFTLDGKLVEIFDLPGAYICRPVMDDENVYLATIWSGDKSPNSGFISILDKDNRLISAPAGSEPIYQNGQLQPMHQALKVFHHPHDVCVDEDKNLYVAQWNSGKTYPIKLNRV
ncbi:MAG: 6-bladed beta-propeller [Bacteroidota bacterium]